MNRRKSVAFVYPAVSALTSLFVLSAECERDKSDLIMATAQRLKLGLNAENLRKSGKIGSDEIEVFTPKSNYGRFTRQGLMIARVAAVDINCNSTDLVELVSSQNSRDKWDTSCAAVYQIKMQSDNAGSSTSKGLSHFVEKSSIFGSFLPSRDYIIDVIDPYPAALVDGDNISSLVLMSLDASEECPRSWLFVRGRQNSMLVVEPKGKYRTRVTLCIEKDPSGWAWVSPLLANLAAGDSPAYLLRDLKRAMEKDEARDDILLSVEQVARRNFNQNLLREEAAAVGVMIIDDPTASRESLRAIIVQLEERLVRLNKTERLEGIDLSELKSRIYEDLKKAKANLRQSHN